LVDTLIEFVFQFPANEHGHPVTSVNSPHRSIGLRCC